jgi:hypothetical protein
MRSMSITRLDKNGARGSQCLTHIRHIITFFFVQEYYYNIERKYLYNYLVLYFFMTKLSNIWGFSIEKNAVKLKS